MSKNEFIEYMKKTEPKTFIPRKRLICNWTDNKKQLIQFRMLKFFVRHGIVDDIAHEIISYKQSNWLEQNINFIAQKRNRAENDFEKDSCK